MQNYDCREKIYPLLSDMCQSDLSEYRKEIQRGELRENIHYYAFRAFFKQRVKTVIPNLLSISKYDDETLRQIFHYLFEIKN